MRACETWAGRKVKAERLTATAAAGACFRVAKERAPAREIEANITVATTKQTIERSLRSLQAGVTSLFRYALDALTASATGSATGSV